MMYAANIEQPASGRRWAWVPIPLLLVIIAVAWVANPPGVHESLRLTTLLNVVFTSVATLCISILAGRGLLVSRRAVLLMFGCGALLWGLTALLAPLPSSSANTTVTIHNLGVFGAAVCHLIGVTWGQRQLIRPGRWLVIGYLAAMVAAVGIVALTYSGLTPVFFLPGEGGT